MRSSSQLPLPLPARCSFSRADLVVAPANEHAVAFIDSWPDWPARLAALYGPAGCGKTHLASIWRERLGARILAAAGIAGQELQPGEALAIEDVDPLPKLRRNETPRCSRHSNPAAARSCLQGEARPHRGPAPCLIWRRGFRRLRRWSRGSARRGPTCLAALARKLFSDRQLFVPDAIVEGMLRRLSRTPAAIRDFVEQLDAAALASARPVSLALVRNLIATQDAGLP